MKYRAYRVLVECALFAGVLASTSCTLQTNKPAAAVPTNAPATALIAQAAQRQTVSGKVILAADRGPLPGTPVYLVMTMEQGVIQKLVAQGATDANGQFRFPDALTWDPNNKKSDPQLAQRYYILANSQQHGFSFATILQGDRTDNITVTLVKPLISTITVVDSNGKPLSGATVSYSGGGITEKDAPDWDNNHRWSYFRSGLSIISGTTDTEGKVKLPCLYDGGAYRISKSGYATTYGNNDSTVTLIPGTRLRGIVTLENGTPASAAKVKCAYRDDKMNWSEETVTDASGRYLIDDAPIIPPDDPNSPFVDHTSVEVTIEDPRPDSTNVVKATTRPSVGAEAQLNIQFPKACILAGRIVDEKTAKPLQGIQLQLYSALEDQGSFDSSRTLTSNDQGQFKAVISPGSRVFLMWQDSPSGDYVIDRQWLEEQPENYQYQPFQTEKMTDDKTDLVLKLRLWDVQPLTGIVMDPSGKPSANVTVYLSTYVPPVKTAADGTFTLKCAPRDREFELCALTDDKEQACLVKLPKATNQTTLQLKPTVTREGVVTTPAGLPADRLKFYLDLQLNGKEQSLIREESQTDIKGEFIANNLIPGARYSISWTPDNESNRDYDSGSTKLDLASLKDDQPIQFSAKKYVNALMGQVLGPDGKPVAGAIVTVPPGSDLMPQNSEVRNTPITSDKDGQFTIARLADGEITLEASAAGFKPGTARTNTDNIEAKISLRALSDPTVYRAKVVDAQGKPAEGVAVTMVSMQIDRQGKSASGTTVVKTDSGGIARFRSPATAPTTQPVQYSQTMMLCDADGYDIACSPPVTMDKDIDAQFTLAKSDKHWQGKVVDDKGSPIAGASIQIESYRQDDREYVSLDNFSETSLACMGCATNAEGEFTLSRLGRDRWVSVKITSPGMKTMHLYFDPEQNAATDCKTVAMVKGAGLKGRIVLKSTRTPLAPQNGTGSHIMIMKASGAYGTGAQLKPDGTFSSDELEAGTYSVRFVSADPELRKYILKNAPTVTTKTGETADLTVELEEGIALKGRITNLPSDISAKAPQDQIGTVIATRSGERNYTAYSTIDKEGQWTMYLPDNGKYTIRCYVAVEGARSEQSAGIIEVKDNKAPADMVIEYKPAK